MIWLHWNIDGVLSIASLPVRHQVPVTQAALDLVLLSPESVVV